MPAADNRTMNRLLVLLFTSCALMSVSALADDAAVLQCRALPDTARRLACYDAMPLGNAQSAPAQTPEQAFGMAPPSKKAATPETIHSTVAGRLDGWSPGAQIRLANDQVWRVTDDSDAVLPVLQNPPVTVSRGLLGAYFLQVDGYKSTARVARVR
jgi:hypothetical protein